MDDGCQSLRWDYRSEVNDLESELETVEIRVRAVKYSCDYEFTLSFQSLPSKQKGNPMCELYKSYKGHLPNNMLLDMCKKNMTEADCKKCLSIK